MQKQRRCSLPIALFLLCFLLVAALLTNDPVRAAAMELIRDGGVIDQYYEETKASAEMDAQALRPNEEFDYRASVQHLKDWLRERIAWIDENFDSLDTIMHKITYIVDGEKYQTGYILDGAAVNGDEPHPEFPDRTFLHWLDENGAVISSPTAITTDRTFMAEYVSDSDITFGRDIAFVKNSEIISYNSFFSSYSIRIR